MHGPTGWAGVQAVLKSGHSSGLMTPLMISPQLQPSGVRALRDLHVEKASGVVAPRIRRGPRGRSPGSCPGPSTRGGRLEDLVHHLQGGPVPPPVTLRGIGVSHAGRARLALAHDRSKASRISTGSKPATTAGIR